MALPLSGIISFKDFNIQRGQASPYEQQIDMATAATLFGVSYTTDGSNPASMDEFYGKGIGTPPPPTPPPPTPPPPTPPPPTPPPPTPPPPTPPPPTPPPISFSVQVGCAGDGTPGTGTLRLYSITGGGPYSYLVGYSDQSGNPATYATTNPTYPTEHTFYNVPNGSYIAYVYQPATQKGAAVVGNVVSCNATPAPTPPPPTPAPVYYIQLSSGTTACEAKQNWGNIV